MNILARPRVENRLRQPAGERRLHSLLMNTKIVSALVAAFIGAGSLFAGGEGWTHDLPAAKATAAKDKKDLLLDFTGSDWCPPC